MVWIPSLDYILKVFEAYIEKPILSKPEGLIGTLDKVQWGIPFQGPPTIWDQATILYRDIIEEHYFSDGNKRIGSLIMYIFLKKNDIDFSPTIGEIYSFTMEIAQGLKTYDEIKKWIEENSKIRK